MSRRKCISKSVNSDSHDKSKMNNLQHNMNTDDAFSIC